MLKHKIPDEKQMDIPMFFGEHRIVASCLFCSVMDQFKHIRNQPYNKSLYYMAELVDGEKEYSDWFLERSVFCYTDR